MTTETVKQFFEKAHKSSYSTPVPNPNFSESLGSEVQPNKLPKSIQEAFYYYKILHERDIGDVYVYEVNVDGTTVYAVSGFNADGEDGHLEIYSKTGELIACGQYQYQIDWMSQFKTRDLWDEYEGPEAIKQFFENGFKESTDRQSFVKKLGEKLDLNDLPKNVKQAYSFYKKNVEDAYWGSVEVYDVSIEYTSVYTVNTVTEADETFSELYTSLGEKIACARYDSESFSWTTQENIRTYVSK